MSQNRTWTSFGGGPREALNPIRGGSLWMGAIAIYTSGTTFLGVLGFSVGWAMFQILTILTVNVAGLLTGEWRQNGGADFEGQHCGGYSSLSRRCFDWSRELFELAMSKR